MRVSSSPLPKVPRRLLARRFRRRCARTPSCWPTSPGGSARRRSGRRHLDQRRQDAFLLAGAPRAVRRGQTKAALADLLGFYNAHVGGTADRHPAAASTTPAGTPNGRTAGRTRRRPSRRRSTRSSRTSPPRAAPPRLGPPPPPARPPRWLREASSPKWTPCWLRQRSRHCRRQRTRRVRDRVRRRRRVEGWHPEPGDERGGPARQARQ